MKANPEIVVIVNMSLRDYFAAKAMQSIIAKSPYEINSYEESKNKIELCAIGSYVYADAMLKAREAEK